MNLRVPQKQKISVHLNYYQLLKETCRGVVNSVPIKLGLGVGIRPRNTGRPSIWAKN
jgi:hypothetical protein